MLNFLALNTKKGTNLWLQSSMSFSRTEMHGKAEMRRGLWRSSSPTCSNRVSLSRLLGAISCVVLNFSKMESLQPLWTTFSSCQLLSQSKKPWTLFQLYGISHISVCSHGLSSFLCSALKTEKTLVPPSLHHIRYLYTLKWSPTEASLLPAAQIQLIQPLLSVWCSSPNEHFFTSAELTPVCPCLPLLGSTVLDSGFQMCLTSAEQRGKITFLNLLAMIFLMQLLPGSLSANLLSRWLVSHAWSSQDPLWQYHRCPFRGPAGNNNPRAIQA